MNIFYNNASVKTLFLTLIECQSVSDRVAILPGIKQFIKKNLEFKNFEKKPGIFNNFQMLSSKILIRHKKSTI